MGKLNRFRSAICIALVVGMLAPPALLLVVDTAPPVSAEPGWHDPNWSYRRPITIENTGTLLDNYQVKISVTYDNDMRGDFGDLRFTDSDEVSLLSYWIESYTDSDSATVWVKVPLIPVSPSKTIYMYYGNPGAASESDGDATFEAFGLKKDGPIAAGYYHTVALLDNGKIKSWGRNNYGQLGDGTRTDRSEPVSVIGISNAVAVAAGEYHTIALLSDNTIKSWGRNNYGQLGDGTRTDRSEPVSVIGINTAVAVAAGAYHTVALLDNGEIKSWGYNGYGQLGDGTTTNRSLPVSVLGISNVVAVAAGDYHTIALLDNGEIKSWGRNNYGQLGDGTTTNRSLPVSVLGISNAVAVAAGAYHTVALLDNGEVKSWGRNNYGQLGDGTTTNRSLPVSVLGISNAVAVAAGEYHTVALLSDNTIKSWGHNSYGQLGDGTTTRKSVPESVLEIDSAVGIAAGAYHTVALLDNGEVKSWGRNNYGQLGDGTTTNKPVPVSVLGIRNAVAVAAGYYHTVALLSDNTIKSWGYNYYGQLGDGTTTNRSLPVSVLGISNVVAVAAGKYHTVALLDNGEVKSWGRNNYGQLGDGTTTSRYLPVSVSGITNAVAVAAGDYHTVALLDNGEIKSWGYNYYGQLGDGTTTNRSLPVSVSGITNAVAVTAGGYHTLALLDNGEIKSWGRNNRGQLGDGTETDRSLPVSVLGISNAVAVTAGYYHTVALLSDNTIKSWGYNGYGQLGDGTRTSSSVPVSVMGISNAVAVAAGYYHTVALLSDNTTKSWGHNDYGQLGDGTTTDSSTPVSVWGISNAVAVAAGAYHTVALLDNGEIKSWGRNNYGQLGDGTAVADSSTPVSVQNLNIGGLYCKLDDVYVIRKYASPEPTTGVGAEQIVPPPILTEPADGTITNDNTPTFRWDNDLVYDNYEIWIDNDLDFSSPAAGFPDNTVDNYYDLNIKLPEGLADENYFWRVRAYLGGVGTDFSEVLTFLIDTVAPPPPSSSPNNGLVTEDRTPTLNWSDVIDTSDSETGEAAGFANYEIWIDNDPNFTDNPLKDNSTTSSYTLASELVDENYTFKVRAWDKVGNVGEWSDNWTFFVDTTDFLVSASCASLELLRGGSASLEISAELTQGEPENVDWSYGWEGTPPSGVTDNFNPENIAMPCSFDLTFNTQAGADTGEFVYHVTGTSVDPEDEIGVTEKSRTVDITLTVAGMIFSIDAYPRELKLMRSDTVGSTVSVEFLFGSRENVNLTGGWISTDPSISYNLEPTSHTPPFNSTLTFESPADTTAGSYAFRVNAYGSGITRVVDIPVDVIIALTLTLNANEQSYKRGQEIRISGEVVDPKGNPVGNGTAMIMLSCGGWSKNIISAITDGTYSADYLIALDDPGGEWTIAVDAEDNRGNFTLTPENITVNVTTNLTVTAATDASAYEKGQKIRISGTAKDPKGNLVESGEATITLKSGNWADQLVAQITSGTYEENYYITFDKPEGDWTITVSASDNLGNFGQAPESIRVSVSIPAAWKYYTITFLSPTPDTVCSRGAEVPITVQITEGSKKISEADVYLATPSGEIITLTEGSPGIYSTTYVPRWDDPLGEWTVSVLGEKTVQGTYKAGTGSTSIDITPASLKLELLEPRQRTFEIGEKVDVKVRVNYPEGSPVDEAIVVIDLPNGENLTLLNEGEGIYGGTYSVSSKDLGAWALTVSAVDAYGNSGTSSEVSLSIEELSPSSYPTRYWWITIPVALACALAPLPIVVKKLRIRKLKSIKSEIRATEKLRKELPKRYFVKGAISRESYDSLMHQTVEKLMKLKKESRKLKKKLGRG